MKTIHERIKEERDKKGLSMMDLAELVGVKSWQTVQQWENGKTAPSRKRLKLVADVLSVSVEYLLQGIESAHSTEISTIPSAIATSKNQVTINQFDAQASMGTGLELPDQPGVIQSWSVDKRWLDLNVRTYSAAKNLCIVTGFGDSMIGMFNPGDPLLVDMGVKTVEFDAAYFFRIGNQGYIKRLQRIPTENGLVLKAISANKEVYEPFDITEKMDFQVIGRVLKVWESTDF